MQSNLSCNKETFSCVSFLMEYYVFFKCNSVCYRPLLTLFSLIRRSTFLINPLFREKKPIEDSFLIDSIGLCCTLFCLVLIRLLNTTPVFCPPLKKKERKTFIVYFNRFGYLDMLTICFLVSQ